MPFLSGETPLARQSSTPAGDGRGYRVRLLRCHNPSIPYLRSYSRCLAYGRILTVYRTGVHTILVDRPLDAFQRAAPSRLLQRLGAGVLGLVPFGLEALIFDRAACCRDSRYRSMLEVHAHAVGGQETGRSPTADHDSYVAATPVLTRAAVAIAGGSAILSPAPFCIKDCAVGAYGGRVAAKDIGVAATVGPNSGGNDPTMTTLVGVHTAI